MPMLKLKNIIDKMEQIENSPEFDGWEAWIQLHDWLVMQKPPEAEGLANWDDTNQSVHLGKISVKEFPPKSGPWIWRRRQCK